MRAGKKKTMSKSKSPPHHPCQNTSNHPQRQRHTSNHPHRREKRPLHSPPLPHRNKPLLPRRRIRRSNNRPPNPRPPLDRHKTKRLHPRPRIHPPRRIHSTPLGLQKIPRRHLHRRRTQHAPPPLRTGLRARPAIANVGPRRSGDLQVPITEEGGRVSAQSGGDGFRAAGFRAGD